MIRKLVVLCSLIYSCQSGLLGAGKGEGSCAAPPFRSPAEEIKWSEGCPDWAACCTEYGYCQPRASWEAKLFRDCNGESNGIELPEETVQAEGEEGGDFGVPVGILLSGEASRLVQQSAPPLY
eukprot:TRINITY_DN37792_c0_g1_i1.p1 TRINITY_DN37792_c0_g1~~TRINITY_DN37792_c0_g1_i1.p1  ORF type:complete len:123 (+),score=36.28 TRINITY_DN37792_c0_g1_i1:97-465(+)